MGYIEFDENKKFDIIFLGRVAIDFNLPFLREQAVAVTNHRFGTPLDLAEGLL